VATATQSSPFRGVGWGLHRQKELMHPMQVTHLMQSRAWMCSPVIPGIGDIGDRGDRRPGGELSALRPATDGPPLQATRHLRKLLHQRTPLADPRFCTCALGSSLTERNGMSEERDAEAMIWKLLRPLELALLAVIGAVAWVINWVEPQSTPMKRGVGMLLGVAATMTVAVIYARLR
jgi:hypothetical protein